MNALRSTDLAVIGAGPGGYAAAFLAADLGMEVTLIDPAPNPGGVCLYRGCIPSKALLHVAKVITESREAANWGVTFKEPKLDIDRMRAWKSEVVEKLTGGLGQLSKRRKIDYLQGRGRFRDGKTLTVAVPEGEQDLRFKHAIIATGSVPAMIPGVPENPKRIIDSTGALELPDVPKKFLVVGGGYIGLELGMVYAALGSQVTVVEMMDSLLPGVDGDLVRPLARRVEEQFAGVHLKTKVAAMKETGDGVEVVFEGEHEDKAVFDKVLISVGRKPSTGGLKPEKAGVEMADGGFIRVNEKRRTSAANIYAIGDVAGQPMLAHKASHEGRTAVQAIAGREVAFEPRAIPAVVFTDPEIAWCGLTETEAKKAGRKVDVGRFPWAASGRSITLDRTDGVTKVIADPESGRVLGVGMCGPGAGELIAEGVLAVEMGATAEDLDLCIHPHPTLSETVMEAAASLFGTATHIYRPKRS